MLLFSSLTIADCCGELGELVSEGLIIRLSQVRVLVGPPIKSIAYDQFPSLLNIPWDTHGTLTYLNDVEMVLMSCSTEGIF